MKELVHDEARDVFLMIQNCATIVTSEALASHAKWPFVTIPHFEVRGREMNELSNTLMLGFSPLVPNEDKNGWLVYSNHQQGWIQEGIEYSADLHYEAPVDVQPIPQVLHTETSIDNSTGPYLPIWQQSPAPYNTQAVNLNLFSNEVFARVFHGMQETMHPVLSEATDLEFFYGGSIRDEVNHPHSFLLQPVFQDFNETNRDASHVKGVVVAILPWDHYYENILPPEAHGIVVVMRDTCGGEFSYQVNGKHVEFLGYGDFHDPSYAHLEESTEFLPFERLNFSDTHDHCEYNTYIFPSVELESDYRTGKPIIYSVLVVMVFAVTAGVFFLYDLLVTIRQQRVMLAAKKSKYFFMHRRAPFSPVHDKYQAHSIVFCFVF